MGGSQTTNISPKMSDTASFKMNDIVSGSRNNHLQNLMVMRPLDMTTYMPQTDMQLTNMINLKPILTNVGKGALNGAIGAIHF